MTAEKWHQFSLYEQLGNILSEINHAHNRKKAGELENYKKYLKWILELIDLTLLDGKHKCNLKEIKILRNIIVDKLIDGNCFDVSFEDIQNYLLPFAILARK